MYVCFSVSCFITMCSCDKNEVHMPHCSQFYLVFFTLLLHSYSGRDCPVDMVTFKTENKTLVKLNVFHMKKITLNILYKFFIIMDFLPRSFFIQ